MKYLIISLLTFVFLGSCKTEKVKKDLSKTDFIYLSNQKFKHKDSTFFPLMLNYPICFRKIGNEYVVSPFHDYEIEGHFEGSTKDSALHQIKGHMKLIKEMGFNTIRLVADQNLWSIGDTETYDIVVYKKHDEFERLRLIDNYQMYFDGIHEFIDIAQELDLRIMLLINKPFDDEIKDFTEALLKEFSDEPTIFAYDFFNEPLYFDNNKKDKNRSKEDAYNIVSEWKTMMDENAPNQLLTIGYSEPIEVLEWDPSILPVDFVAFHTYHPLRVPNEIYWYSKYIGKPWMLGETALPSDDDSIKYSDQVMFMKEAYQRTIDCGGAGFGWWAFQDVNWGGAGHDITSLLNRKGITWTKDKQHKIVGTMKPAAKVVKELKHMKSTHECPCWENYQNMLGYNNMVIKGKIINGNTQKPIEGAVVRGWTKNWAVGSHTFTDKEGNFMLFTNAPYFNFEISAPGMTKIKFNQEIEYKSRDENSPPFESLKNADLEYQSISYKPFLQRDTTGNYEKIFDFKNDAFKKYHYIGHMEDKILYRLDFLD